MLPPAFKPDNETHELRPKWAVYDAKKLSANNIWIVRSSTFSRLTRKDSEKCYEGPKTIRTFYLFLSHSWLSFPVLAEAIVSLTFRMKVEPFDPD